MTEYGLTQSDQDSYKTLLEKAKIIDKEYEMARQKYTQYYRTYESQLKVMRKEKETKILALRQHRDELIRRKQQYESESGSTTAVDDVYASQIYQHHEKYLSRNCQHRKKLLKVAYKGCVKVIGPQIDSIIRGLLEITDDRVERKRDGYRAYGLLLSACKLKGENNYQRILQYKKSKGDTDSLTKIMERISDKYPLEDDILKKSKEILQSSIEAALSLTCKMMVLLPPAIVHQPDTFKEKWLETHSKTWDEAVSSGLRYYRPVLFHGGTITSTVAVQGFVGNFEGQQANNTDSGQENSKQCKKLQQRQEVSSDDNGIRTMSCTKFDITSNPAGATEQPSHVNPSQDHSHTQQKIMCFKCKLEITSNDGTCGFDDGSSCHAKCNKCDICGPHWQSQLYKVLNNSTVCGACLICCKTCKESINIDYIRVKGIKIVEEVGAYHVNCYKCKDCSKSIDGESKVLNLDACRRKKALVCQDCASAKHQVKKNDRPRQPYRSHN